MKISNSMKRAVNKINFAFCVVAVVFLMLAGSFEILGIVFNTLTMHQCVIIWFAVSIFGGVAALWYQIYSKFSTAVWLQEAAAGIA